MRVLLLTLLWAESAATKSRSLLQSKLRTSRCEGPTWGIWIDGKDATGGSEAYGANYSSLMKHALQEVYVTAGETLPADLKDRSMRSVQQFEHLATLLEMPLYKDVGLLEMDVHAGKAFQGIYGCLNSSLPKEEIAKMFRTELDSIYDAECILQGAKPCRRYWLPRQQSLLRLFESYHWHLARGDAPLPLLASLLKGLALLHPMPDRNGRSRLLLLQLELRRLKIACGTMNFNNNNNVYVDSVETLTGKLHEGIAMYNMYNAGSSENPWLDRVNVQEHKSKFPVRFERVLSECYAKHGADIGVGLLPG